MPHPSGSTRSICWLLLTILSRNRRTWWLVPMRLAITSGIRIMAAITRLPWSRILWRRRMGTGCPQCGAAVAHLARGGSGQYFQVGHALHRGARGHLSRPRWHSPNRSSWAAMALAAVACSPVSSKSTTTRTASAFPSRWRRTMSPVSPSPSVPQRWRRWLSGCTTRPGPQGIEMLLDDRDATPGVKLNDADLIGLPLRLTIGPRSLKAGGAELKQRDSADATLVRCRADHPNTASRHCATVCRKPGRVLCQCLSQKPGKGPHGSKQYITSARTGTPLAVSYLTVALPMRPVAPTRKIMASPLPYWHPYYHALPPERNTSSNTKSQTASGRPHAPCWTSGRTVEQFRPHRRR